METVVDMAGDGDCRRDCGGVETVVEMARDGECRRDGGWRLS